MQYQGAHALIACLCIHTYSHMLMVTASGGVDGLMSYCHMLVLIRRPRMVVLTGRRPKTLGDINGPSDQIVATCLGRMVNWWKLVEAVLET